MATKKATAAKVQELVLENPAGTTDMVKWDEQFAADAKIAASVTASGGGDFLSFKNGQIVTPDKQVVPGAKMEVVVVSHIFENDYFEGTYDPNNPGPPVCFAFGTKVEDMVPHELSAKPQSDKCATCWANQYKSDPIRKKGKACKNLRRLAFIAGDEDSLKNIADEKLLFAKVPVTSGKNWDNYVRDSAATLNRPPYALVTQITAAPDPNVQVTVTFALASKITKTAHFQALMEKHVAADKLIYFPYQPKTEEDSPAAPARGSKFAGKGTPAKAAAKGAGRR